MRRYAKLGVALWLTGAAVALGPHQAWGDRPFPHNAGGLDGTYVTACWNDSGSIPAELTAHWNYLAGDIESSTNLTFHMQDDCDVTTDMRFDESLTLDGYTGLWTCAKAGGSFGWTLSSSDFECDSGRVQINPTWIASACSYLPLSSVRRGVWCHESGHSLGFDDTYGDPDDKYKCMNGGCTTDNEYGAGDIVDLYIYY